jgi:hypothetical protein
MNGLMHCSKRHLYSIISPRRGNSFFFLRGYIEIGRSRSALPMAAPSEKLNGGAQLDYGKATVGYIVHRISRVNLKNMFKESGTPMSKLRYVILAFVFGFSTTPFAQDMTASPA